MLYRLENIFLHVFIKKNPSVKIKLFIYCDTVNVFLFNPRLRGSEPRKKGCRGGGLPGAEMSLRHLCIVSPR